MFNVHGWAYSILLYTISVGFGIAYSVSRAMREPYTRDKQSGRFPRSFYMLPPTHFSLQRQGNRAGKKLRPTRIRVLYMRTIDEIALEELSLPYEHLMKNAFKCDNNGEYSFVHADFFRYAIKYPYEYPIYVKCALIILFKDENQYKDHKDELKAAIQKLEKEPTIVNTDNVLIDLVTKEIIK